MVVIFIYQLADVDLICSVADSLIIKVQLDQSYLEGQCIVSHRNLTERLCDELLVQIHSRGAVTKIKAAEYCSGGLQLFLCLHAGDVRA